MKKMLPNLSVQLVLLQLVLFALAPAVLADSREQTLYVFPGGSQGYEPQGGVVFDAAGDAYGTTYYDGTYSAGTVFELKRTTHGWRHKVLYSFEGVRDGMNPMGNLVIDASGNLYGTTLYGGSGTGCLYGSDDGCGTVFELSESNGKWQHTILYSFCSVSGCSDGASPYGLAIDTAGNLYGVTEAGGTGCQPDGCGTVYELTQSNSTWTESVLYAFDQNNQGAFFPGEGGIALDGSGNLYGTTYAGGTSNYGIVFELKHKNNEWKEVVLYNFTGSNGDYASDGGLTIAGPDQIYGVTTEEGNGCNYNCGTIFALTYKRKQWTKTVIYSFDGIHGASPNPGLVLDKSGSLYGTTFMGGSNNNGVAFELKAGKKWQIQVLHTFTGGNDGANPYAGLTFGPDGKLYGTTSSTFSDGQYGGTVFEVTP